MRGRSSEQPGFPKRRWIDSLWQSGSKRPRLAGYFRSARQMSDSEGVGYDTFNAGEVRTRVMRTR